MFTLTITIIHYVTVPYWKTWNNNYDRSAFQWSSLPSGGGRYASNSSWASVDTYVVSLQSRNVSAKQ